MVDVTKDWHRCPYVYIHLFICAYILLYSQGSGSSSAYTSNHASNEVIVNEDEPTCTLLLKYSALSSLSKQKRKRITLNASHTCRDLYTYVKQMMKEEEGMIPSNHENGFLLLAGFPPSSLTSLDLTLEDAGLDGDQITLQWT